MFRVMCVDDNRDLADSEVMLLRTHGYDARACYDGPGAIRLAATFRPTVCLIDLNMPGMDGDELAGRLRASWAGEPPVLIAVTAMNNEDALRRIAEAFDQHLVKPVDPRELVRLIDAQAEVGRPDRPAGE
ncbi:response regulator [Urbifossiella limnaea]|uniref:Transcriptional regulatory protein WalR n=1 Tax=Urbifossiella limnaea TaxID=2528023 RepID=A0A517XPU1_9BACT|nr:response regulator [Urbifossiella limnaea]QDU19525.1 Transcriptional regulatory protein WalR [Urbifossiella limnaea]